MKYPVIYLDADGTLFDYDAAEKAALAGAFRDFGLGPVSSEQLARYREINSRMWRGLENGVIGKEELRTERFRLFFSDWDAGPSPEAFSSRYLVYLAEGGQLFPGVEDIIKRIRPGRQLIIVTNGIKEVQVSRLAHSPIKPFIDLLVTSEEIGAPKPDPAMFFNASKMLGLSDSVPALMVGDSLTSDIQGGINFGIDTCWYNPKGLESDPPVKPTYVIQDLSELINII